MPVSKVGVEEARSFIHGPALSDALARLARETPDRLYLTDRGAPLTVGRLDERVDAAAEHLRELGVDSRSRVGLALGVGADHVALIFALLRLGALWVPLNTQLVGDPLAHQLRDSGATHVITEPGSGLADQLGERVSERFLGSLSGASAAELLVATLRGDDASGGDAEPGEPAGDRKNACLLMYTSGTTGPPKGALVSETMLRGAVLGAIEVTEPEPGDVFYVWEPLFHIGGAQVVFIPLFREVSLALVPRFSASRFWSDIVAYDVTHIHYLGGVLQILLQLPVSAAERENRVRVAWGAGATPEVREACRGRYDFALHECYGMTETSSIVTFNRDESDGGVGFPLPWVEIEIGAQGAGADASADPAAAAEASVGEASASGEIRVRGRVEGMLTEGYLGNPEASRKARDGEWFRTGDLGYLDERGRLHFSGRGSDSIRVRGENVSAWQVESVLGLHPAVDRCAVVGVEAEIGEQEMLLFFTLAEGCAVEPREVLEWGATRLARFQVPRYARIVDEMPLTPSQRIAKHRLPKDLEGAQQLTR